MCVDGKRKVDLLGFVMVTSDRISDHLTQFDNDFSKYKRRIIQLILILNSKSKINIFPKIR